MEIITKAAKMRAVSNKLCSDETKIGLVPTMGVLHEGHLSMVRNSSLLSDVTVVSIFVDPAQFRSEKEFENFPRDLARDADQLSPIGVDYIFAPGYAEMYPPGFSSYVEVTGLSDKLEGVSMPGYFRSVTTALSILFNIIQPQFVFLGQRDAQQAVIVKRLIRDLHLPVEVVITPTMREEDGLACASRNRYLTPEQRQASPALYRSIRLAEKLFADGERNSARLIKALRKEMENEPLARIDYIAVTDTEVLDDLDDLSERPGLVTIAAWFGNTRLVDNVILSEDRFKSKTGRLKLG
ncbi:MAG: pantoate--beta-alanine ligase [Acidobacteriota bacterium]|nr:MAG: pantoate--beta-alanine ligase [Acidobacteriota bacterium]